MLEPEPSALPLGDIPSAVQIVPLIWNILKILHLFSFGSFLHTLGGYEAVANFIKEV